MSRDRNPDRELDRAPASRATDRARRPARPGSPATFLLPAAGLLALAIFAFDTATPFGMAVAVLYVLVVLIAGAFLRPRGILLTSAACVMLTVLSFALTHEDKTSLDALVRCLMSLSAIAITTFLVLRNNSTNITLREQARLLDLSHDTIFVHDMHDVITYWNNAAESMYGWSTSEALGEHSHGLLRTEFPVPLADIQQELTRTGRWEGELVHTTRDGTRLQVSSRWSLKRDERGTPVAILETNNDISSQKRAEALLRQHERDLRLTIDSIPTLVAQLRPDGFVEYLNRRWLIYTGLTLEEAIGWGWQKAVHPDDLDSLLAARNAALSSGRPAEIETRLRRVDGNYRWMLIRNEPLRDADGIIIRWYSATIDIEDRKAAEQALRRSEAFLAEAQRVSLTGSFGWRIDRGDIVWSDETYRIFDYERSRTPTIDLVLARVHPDDVGLVKAAVARAIELGSGMDLTHRLALPDGTVKYVRVLAHEAKDRAHGREYIGAITDLTAAELAQRALQKAQADLAHATRVATLGELATSIVHEVNQPLAAIVTNGEACLRWLDRTPPDIHEVHAGVEAMIRDGIRASDVVRRLRAHAKKADPQKTEVDLDQVVEEALLVVQRELANQRIAVRTNLAGRPACVLGDKVQLQQVLINLVMNGADAMAEVEGLRELTITSRLLDSGEVAVAVQDGGKGFGTTEPERLFDTFYSTKPNGMGMGLPIARSIVESHGGSLRPLPGAGPGATFEFTLPLVARR